MKTYNYDRETNEFIGTEVLIKNPDNQYYPPAFSTLKQVPLVPIDKAAVFDVVADIWVLVDDYRGHVAFDLVGIEHRINEIGVIPDAAWLSVKPFVLSEAQETKKKEIESAFNNALTTVNAINITWHSGLDTAQRLDGARRLADMAGLILVDFTDVNRVKHSLSIADAVKVILAVGGDFQVKFMKKQKLLIDVANSKNQSEIDAIAW